MRKRFFLVMTIALTMCLSLFMSITALAKSVGEESVAKVREVIIDEIGEVKEKIEEQNEVATVTKVTQNEETTAVGIQGKEALVEMISVNPTPLETESIETEATEPEVSETEPTEVPREEFVLPQEEDLEDWLHITLVETKEDDTRIYSLNNRLYTVPDVIVNEEPRVTDSGYVEKIYNVPQYFQQAYPKTRYGNHGTVSSHGCGITSIAMVYSYLLDEEITPDRMAEEYGKYNTEHGSAWSLFEAAAEDYGIQVTRVHLWQDVVEALENGCVVISNVRENLFTAGGHFIVYYGITEDGKVLVRDPNIYNFGEWSANALKEGFYNGFEDKYVKYSFPCWVYAPKDLDAIANAAS